MGAFLECGGSGATAERGTALDTPPAADVSKALSSLRSASALQIPNVSQLGLSSGGESESYARAFTDDASDVEDAAVGFHDAFANGESQTRTALGT